MYVLVKGNKLTVMRSYGDMKIAGVLGNNGFQGWGFRCIYIYIYIYYRTLYIIYIYILSNEHDE